jgi:hypothetical protein
MTSRRPRTAPGVSFATHRENLIDRYSVRLGAGLLRRTRGRVVRLWHRRALVLTTRGRGSGSPRTVVLQYFPDGRDDYGQFVREARNAGYDEVARFFEQVMKEDSKRAAKCHALMRELPGKEDVAQAADADAGRSSRRRPVIFWPVPRRLCLRTNVTKCSL